MSVVQRMFVGAREALRQRVSSSAHLDYYARQAALDKLAAMTVQVSVGVGSKFDITNFTNIY